MLEILKYLNKILFFKFKFGVSAILNKKKNKNALEKTCVLSPECSKSKVKRRNKNVLIFVVLRERELRERERENVKLAMTKMFFFSIF